MPKCSAGKPDPRDPERIDHKVGDLLRQCIYALCCGYEPRSLMAATCTGTGRLSSSSRAAAAAGSVGMRCVLVK